MSTVTNDTTTTTEPSPTPDDSRQVHLVDAQRFFAAEPAADAKTTTTEAPKTAEQAAAPAKPADKIAAVIKLPGSTQKTEVAPVVDAAVEDIAKDLTPPDEKSKSFAGWKELKTRAQAHAERAAKLERELSDLRKTAESSKATAPVDEATRARLTQLETENKAFSDRLKVLDLRNHPEFVSKFVTPQDQAKAQLAAVVKSEEVNINLDGLLALSGKKFNVAVSEALETLTPYGRVRFQAALDGLLAARVGAEDALAKADESLKSFSQNSGARSRAEFDKVAGQYNGLYAPISVDDKAADEVKQAAAAYNADLAAISKSAEQYAFGSLDETKAAELAHKAALFDFTVARGIPRIGELFNAELAANAATIAALEKQVKELTAASPRLDGGGSSGGGNPPTEESHLEAARRINFRR